MISEMHEMRQAVAIGLSGLGLSGGPCRGMMRAWLWVFRRFGRASLDNPPFAKGAKDGPPSL
ncbi:MAG: hypothetical protein ACRD3K_01100 [Edaphobacter sp.]